VPSRPPTPGRRWTGRTVRAGSNLLRTLYIAVALIGMLVTPPIVVLFVVPVLTVSAVVLLAGSIRYCQQRWPTSRTLTGIAGPTVALVPFQHGIDLLDGAGTVILLVVLALATVVGAASLHGLNIDADSAPAPDSTADREQSLRELLHVLPLETVLREWRTLQHPTRRTRQPDPTPVVQARRLLLDEMQRRDPAGFAAWLAAGGNQPPDGHIHDDRACRPEACGTPPASTAAASGWPARGLQGGRRLVSGTRRGRGVREPSGDDSAAAWPERPGGRRRAATGRRAARCGRQRGGITCAGDGQSKTAAAHRQSPTVWQETLWAVLRSRRSGARAAGSSSAHADGACRPQGAARRASLGRARTCGWWGGQSRPLQPGR
jgi:hypothetical protein